MSTATTFRSVQKRVSALQETTAQARKLIAQLEARDPADDGAAAPHGNDEGDYVNDFNGHADESRGPCFASELTAEILQLLEEQRDELEEIEEEMHDMREGKSEEARHEKARLVEGIRQAREGLRRTRLDLRAAQTTYISHSRNSHLRYRDVYLAEVVRPLSAAASATSRNGTPSLQNSISSLPAETSTATAELTGLETPSTSNSTDGSQRQRKSSLYSPPKPITPKPVQARPALFNSNRKPKYKSSRPSSDSPEQKSSSEAITSSLLHLHASMSSSLERSSFAAKMVEESSNSLKQLSDQYESLDSLLEKSRGLLRVLVRSAKTDAWYLQTSVYVLVFTLAWLVFRRWLYGPLWWLVWLPLRMIWGTGKVALGGASGGGAGPGKQAGDAMVAGAGAVSGGSAADQVVRIRTDAPVVQVDKEGGVPPARVAVAEGQDKSMVDEIGKMIDEESSHIPKPVVEAGSIQNSQGEPAILNEGNPVQFVGEGQARIVTDEL